MAVRAIKTKFKTHLCQVTTTEKEMRKGMLQLQPFMMD